MTTTPKPEYIYDESQIIAILEESDPVKMFQKELMPLLLGKLIYDSLTTDQHKKASCNLKTVMRRMDKEKKVDGERLANKGAGGSTALMAYGPHTDEVVKKSAKDFFLGRRPGAVYDGGES